MSSASKSHVFDKEKLLATVLQKTQVVTDVKTCLDITVDLNDKGNPIGVDLEAVNGPPGMVQVSSINGDIYLFRTGINDKLITDGGIKDLMENPKVLKVMHDATGDCLSFHQGKVKLSSLFDTNIADKIITYQSSSKPFNINSLSFNDICMKNELPENPLKAEFSGFAWLKNERKLISLSPLSKDFLLYCAFDVFPLLELYEKLKTKIEPDFWPVFHELCENQMVRPIDKHLVKSRQNAYQSRFKRDIFVDFSSSKQRISKGNLYSKFSKLQIDKVLFNGSDSCAHILMEDHDSAINLANFCQTLDDFHASMTAREESTENLPDSENKSWKLSKDLIDHLISTQTPVLLQFSTSLPSSINLELYFLQENKIIFDLKDQTLLKMVGPLISDPKTPKIVQRLDVKDCLQGLKIFESSGFPFENIIDLPSAAKICDFAYHGLSSIKTISPSVKTICTRYDIPKSTWKDESYETFIHLMQIMPKNLLPLLNRITREIQDRKAKQKIVKEFESSTIFVKVSDGRCDSLLELMSNRQIPFGIIAQTRNTILLNITNAKYFKTVVEIVKSKRLKDIENIEICRGITHKNDVKNRSLKADLKSIEEYKDTVIEKLRLK